MSSHTQNSNTQQIRLAKPDKDAIQQRLLFLMSLFFCLWLLLVGRMAYLHLFPNPKLAHLNRLRLEQTMELAGERGSILDRHGNRMTFSIRSYSLVADPTLIKDAFKTAKILNQVLTSSTSFFSKKIRKAKKEKKRFIWIAHRVDHHKKFLLEKHKLPGIYFVKDWKRIYTYPHLFSQITGFISKDGRGLEGLEYHWEKTLKSSTKKMRVNRDAKGRSLFSEELLFNPLSYRGNTVQLTLDRSMQYFLKKELKRALELHSAESALGLILDAKTAAVRAMSSVLKKRPVLPSFNLSPFYHKNQVVTDAFEPGSTMKTFVLAALLREGLFSPFDFNISNKKYYCEEGKWKLPSYQIRESNTKEKWGWLNLQEILAKSSNICISKLAFSIGADSYYHVLKDFGFGEKTGIDFPGEVKGILHVPPWTPYQLSRISFGHNLTASALQIARAYVAIANGGMLMRPYLLKSILIPSEERIKLSSGPYPIRRVLKTEHATFLKHLLKGVVSPSGTGYLATIPGNTAGGKTGTAQRVDLKKGGYFSNKYISSFVGFAPVENPRYVVYIAINSPQKNYYASYVAAPIFSKVTSYLLRQSLSQPQLRPQLQPQLWLSSKQKNQLSKEASRSLSFTAPTSPFGSVSSFVSASVPASDSASDSASAFDSAFLSTSTSDFTLDSASDSIPASTSNSISSPSSSSSFSSSSILYPYKSSHHPLKLWKKIKLKQLLLVKKQVEQIEQVEPVEQAGPIEQIEQAEGQK